MKTTALACPNPDDEQEGNQPADAIAGRPSTSRGGRARRRQLGDELEMRLGLIIKATRQFVRELDVDGKPSLAPARRRTKRASPPDRDGATHPIRSVAAREPGPGDPGSGTRGFGRLAHIAATLGAGFVPDPGSHLAQGTLIRGQRFCPAVLSWQRGRPALLSVRLADRLTRHNCASAEALEWRAPSVVTVTVDRETGSLLALVRPDEQASDGEIRQHFRALSRFVFNPNTEALAKALGGRRVVRRCDPKLFAQESRHDEH